jgi:hypothetical protein
MDTRVIMQESLLAGLADYYNNNPEALTYIDKNIPAPQDVDIYALQHNIPLDYKASSRQLTIESFEQVIDSELKRLRG